MTEQTRYRVNRDLVEQAERVTAYDIMDHSEVRTWLKGRTGD